MGWRSGHMNPRRRETMRSDYDWPYPGARWWKFDLHTHTPASRDTYWHPRQGSVDHLTARQWLQRFMNAGIDCVAITDHNSGAWVDGLKAAYEAMQNTGGTTFASCISSRESRFPLTPGFTCWSFSDPTRPRRTWTPCWVPSTTAAPRETALA